MTGLRDLTAALERLPAVVRKRVALANEATARAVQARARANAPRDKGDLVANIAVAGKDLNWRVGILDTTVTSRGGSNRAHLHPSVYGVWYEYGFVTRRIASHPFMRPAVDAEQPRHDERLRQAVTLIETDMARAA